MQVFSRGSRSGPPESTRLTKRGIVSMGNERAISAGRSVPATGRGVGGVERGVYADARWRDTGLDDTEG